MIKKILFIACVMVFPVSSCFQSEESLLIPSLQPTFAPSQDILNYFPLKQGAYWVYQGPIKWTEPNSTDIFEDEITWKMEVKRVVERNSVVGYEMVGAPWDLAWYEKEKEQSKYGIVQAGGKYYRVPYETVIRLFNEEDNLFGLVDESNLMLDIPLIHGERFCDSVSMTRPDGMYCWSVSEGTPYEAQSVAGVTDLEGLWEFTIAQYTMPDYSLIYFVPTVGISGYRYIHHGTVSEVDVKLIEYHPGQ